SSSKAASPERRISKSKAPEGAQSANALPSLRALAPISFCFHQEEERGRGQFLPDRSLRRISRAPAQTQTSIRSLSYRPRPELCRRAVHPSVAIARTLAQRG